MHLFFACNLTEIDDNAFHMARIIKYGIIGSGRLATHILHYFSLLNLDCNHWSRATNNSDQLAELAEESDVIMLLIKDDAIEEFISAHSIIENKFLIHCSGSLVTEKAKGAHPLLSFGPTLYNYQEYKKIPFIVDDDFTEFKTIFPQLENLHYFICKKDKPLYHALCVMSGNFTSILWSKFFDELSQKLNLAPEVAHPYLESICKNLILDYKSALTGPLVRNDQATIRRHLDALAEDRFKLIYESFVELYKKN